MSDKSRAAAAPRRLRRERTKGYRMPEGARYVGRPTRYGNPFTIAGAIENGFADNDDDARAVCVRVFGYWLKGDDAWWQGDQARESRNAILDTLPQIRGKDLACWCPLDQPCHADLLLEIANA